MAEPKCRQASLLLMAVMAASGVVMVGVVMVATLEAAVAAIGAASRLKGSGHLSDVTTRPAHHVSQYMVWLDVNSGCGDLSRGGTIADVLGDFGQPQRRVGGNCKRGSAAARTATKRPSSSARPSPW